MLARFKLALILKIAAILVGLFFIIILAVWLVLPGILKDYIETNDKQWIGRDITIEDIAIQPFSYVITVNNVTIKEPNVETNFIVFDRLVVNFDLWPLLQSKISTQEITLSNLSANVVQNGTQFNFSDLFDTTETAEASAPLEFNLRNINILKSSITYTDTQLGSQILLDSIRITDQKFTSLDSIFDADVAIHQPQGGWVKGSVFYDLENNDYKLDPTIESWRLSPFKNYVTSVIRLSEFEGLLSANLQISGNASRDIIKTSGQVNVSDFKLIDPENKPLVTVGKFFMDIKEIDNTSNVYNFKDILINDSNIIFEYLPNGDNFSKWLVTSNGSSSEANIDSDYYVSPFEMLSVYIYDLTKEYVFKAYNAENIIFSNFNLKFYDYTLEDPFYMDLENLEIKATDIRPENQFADLYVNGKLNKTGILDGDISVSRQGVENMKVDIGVKGLFLNRFSPYGREYTAHRFEEGISSFSIKSEIKDSYLTSVNTFHIENVKVGKKNKTRTGKTLPMRLAVALMKDSKGNIDLEIPIEGPIDDPEYKFGKVIWQVIKNVFTKIATSPFRALSNLFNINEDDLKTIYFDNGQIGLSSLQKKPLDAIAKVLNKKPEFNIELSHLYNKEYEMDAIALKSAKLAYLKQSSLPLDENVPIGKQAFDLPTTDPEFLAYLKTTTPNFDTTISTPENARKLLGQQIINTEMIAAIAKQKELIKEYLITDKEILENRFTIRDASDTDEALNQSRPKFEVKFSVKE